jgi:hypothetical protein
LHRGQCTDIPVYGALQRIFWRDPNQLFELYPDFDDWPSAVGVSAPFRARTAQDATDSPQSPLYWTVYGAQIGLIPAPSQDFIDDVMELVVPYYKMPDELDEAADELLIPPNFYSCQRRLGLWRLKKDLSMQDWKSDFDIGGHMLNKLIAKYRRESGRKGRRLKDGHQ